MKHRLLLVLFVGDEAKVNPASALETLKKKMLSKQQKLEEASRKLLEPVKHTIKVEAM